MPIETSYNGPRQEGVAARVEELISEAGQLLWSEWGTLGAGKNRRLALPLGFTGDEFRLAILACSMNWCSPSHCYATL